LEVSVFSFLALFSLTPQLTRGLMRTAQTPGLGNFLKPKESKNGSSENFH